MSNELIVFNETVETFDEIKINADGRLTYGDGELTAVYPKDSDEAEYVVASFPIENSTVEVPKGAVVLGVSDRLHCLVPADEYGGNE